MTFGFVSTSGKSNARSAGPTLDLSWIYVRGGSHFALLLGMSMAMVPRWARQVHFIRWVLLRSYRLTCQMRLTAVMGNASSARGCARGGVGPGELEMISCAVSMLKYSISDFRISQRARKQPGQIKLEKVAEQAIFIRGNKTTWMYSSRAAPGPESSSHVIFQQNLT